MFRYGEDVPGGRGMTTEIGGRDRFKFFKRPVVPVIEGSTQTAQAGIPLQTRPTIQPRSQQLQTELGGGLNLMRPRTLERLPGAKAANNIGGASSSGMKSKRAASKSDTLRSGSTERAHGGAGDSSALSGGASSDGATRDMGCQTLYRENDCQTDPYTPDYFVKEGEQPEVLAIMELRYGEGLPAGLGEIEMIDRVQRRQLVEANLPQGSDNDAMQRRLVALETLERTEWEEREAHIVQLQGRRLDQMSVALQRREEQREQASKQRIEAVKQAKLREVEARLQALQERRLTATRKLTQKHVNPCCEKEERDVIKAHVLYGPKAKPVKSSSLVEKINSSNYDVRPTLLSFPEGMQELEKTSVPKIERVAETKLQPPEEPAIKQLETNFQKRQAKQVVDHLEYAHKVIEASHETKEKAASIQDLYRATPRLQRPDTPTLTLQGDEDEEREEAMLLLQRLLRGRAVQNDFFEGKERCHGLIEELQSASNARDAEKKRPKWLLDKQEEAEQARRDALVQSVVDGVQGDVIFGAVDYIFKELLRQQEAAKIDQLRNLAEATRRAREEAEQQRRAAERALRAREEAQYLQLARSVDSTVETFLSQTIGSTITTSAQRQALAEQWQRHSARSNKPPQSPLEEEELVCDLLDAFIVPQVCKGIASDRALREKALAHSAISAADVLGELVAKHN